MQELTNHVETSFEILEILFQFAFASKNCVKFQEYSTRFVSNSKTQCV